jgi:hypothetical protein
MSGSPVNRALDRRFTMRPSLRSMCDASGFAIASSASRSQAKGCSSVGPLLVISFLSPHGAR